jgi:high-affinity iron transporter
VASAQQPDAKKLYTQYCAACHGPAGAGDGPAAKSLKPPPASFADSAFQATHSDQHLAAAITTGKPPMPAFGKLLSPAQVKALVAYIRLLGPKAK